ncbi:MAG: (2Fe-2S) ferredoxin domain-containing protein [Atribacterota bacterium]|nr:(2Fe-2S) ferredoxin domain-containing protein [Atribacterota bacterium]
MKNLEELKKIKERVKRDLELRTGKHRIKIVVCLGTCGIAAGARETMNALVELINKSNRSDIIVTTAGCAGFCEQEPMIQVYIEDKEPVVYGKVDSQAAEEIFKKHILKGEIVEKYLFSKGK